MTSAVGEATTTSELKSQNDAASTVDRMRSAPARSRPADAPPSVGASANREATPANPAQAGEAFLRAEEAPSAATLNRAAPGSSRTLTPSLDEAESRAPEEWLKEIRALQAAGEPELAREALEAFKVAWPDYPIPADLQR